MSKLALLLPLIILAACSHTAREMEEPETPVRAFSDTTDTEQRTPARSGDLNPNSKTIKYMPFIVEAYPLKIDPRRGKLEQMTSPIPAKVLRAAVAEGFYPALADLAGVHLSGSRPLDVLLPLVARHIRDSLLRALEDVNDKLPDQPLDYSLVVVPWEHQNQVFYAPSGVSLTGYKTGTDAFGKPQNFYQQVERNIRTIQQEALQSKGPVPAYLLASVVNIRFQKNASKVDTQMLIGLNAMEVPFAQANDQVSFTHLVVPKVSQVRDATVMSMTFEQELKPDAVPIAHVEFGPIAGWKEKVGSLGLKLYSDPKYSCHRRAHVVPYLRGTLGEQAVPGTGKVSTAARKLAKGKPVDFRIYDLKMDISRVQVTEMDLRIGAGFHLGSYRAVVGCIGSESVDQEFQGEVNKTIAQQLKILEKKNLTSVLQTLLTAQQEQK